MPWQGQHVPIQGALLDQAFSSADPHSSPHDLIASVGTPTVEQVFMASKNLRQAFLGAVEGIDSGMLDESGKYGYKHEYDAARYDEHGSESRT